MKLNTLIGSLAVQLQQPQFLSNFIEAEGFLVQSDPRLEFLLERGEVPEYKHSAMPLLKVTFRDSFTFTLDLGEEIREIQTGRFVLYQDSIWLMERKSSMKDATKLPVKNIQNLEIRTPAQENLQRGRVSDFLDRI